PALKTADAAVSEQDLDTATDFLTWVRGGQPAGPLDSEQLLRLRAGLAQLTERLIALHANNKLYRHVQPANVRVTADGRVALVAFDPAANQENAGDAVAYLAPEQAANRLVSSAGDWYGLGVLLFEALTGQLPFTGSVQ